MEIIMTTQDVTKYVLIATGFQGIFVATILFLIVKLSKWRNRALRAERFIADSSGGSFDVKSDLPNVD